MLVIREALWQKKNIEVDLIDPCISRMALTFVTICEACV